MVALRKESVDRNLTWHCIREDVSVALRKESVDRNHPVLYLYRIQFVALRKESVDRNNDDFSVDTGELVSLSARRAWIEIQDAF